MTQRICWLQLSSCFCPRLCFNHPVCLCPESSSGEKRPSSAPGGHQTHLPCPLPVHPVSPQPGDAAHPGLPWPGLYHQSLTESRKVWSRPGLSPHTQWSDHTALQTDRDTSHHPIIKACLSAASVASYCTDSDPNCDSGISNNLKSVRAGGNRTRNRRNRKVTCSMKEVGGGWREIRLSSRDKCVFQHPQRETFLHVYDDFWRVLFTNSQHENISLQMLPAV